MSIKINLEMNLVLKVDDLLNRNIFFMDIVKNTVMDNSNFIRINYSNEDIVTNGIFLLFELKSTSLERYYSKYKCNFNLSDNATILNKLFNIEKQILLSYLNNEAKKNMNTHKIFFKLREQLKTGFLKIVNNMNAKNYNDNDIYNVNGNFKILIKISGLWDNGDAIGLTYKFISIQE